MMRVREATIDDCYALAPRLRREDVAEVYAASRSTPLEALVRGLDLSVMTWAILDGEEVVGMFGVASIDGTDAGSPWMLCSDGLVRIQWQFIRQSRRYIDKLHEYFRVLWNAADVRNVVHLRWIRRCGFEFLSTYTHNDTEFVQFMKIKE
jgi:hypothetical protein